MFIAKRPDSYNKDYTERLVIMSRRAALFMSSSTVHKGWALV